MSELELQVENNNQELELDAVNPIIETDYNNLTNKPKINNVELSGNKSSSELGIITEQQVDNKDTNTLNSAKGYTDTQLQSYRTSANQDTIDEAQDDAIEVVEASVEDIEALIPNQATQQNQLADKSFVNSSIATNTANYISNNGQPFTSVAQLEAYSGLVTNNDYAFVTGLDEQGNTYFDRYKATVTTVISWAKEYRLNNSSFTANQWASINSGITTQLVNQISTNQQNITNLQSQVNSKANDNEVVKHTSQSLTDAQKLQARTNIGTQKIWSGYTEPTPQIISEMAIGDLYVMKEETNRG